MKAVLLFLGAAFCSLQLVAQEVPLIKVGETELGVSKLYIDVAVVGNRMTTTYDMYFYNPTQEILEGELSFPLGEKQAVSRFALEVNGSLREAVAVEKEQGRVAFEAVVRRRIDPALLEKGTGNNYKARIYPIPAEGYKRVLLAYDEELPIVEQQQLVRVPLSFKKKLKEFELAVSIDSSEEMPTISSRSRIKSNFESRDGKYILNFSAGEFKPSQDFMAEIPLGETITVSSYQDYTYGYRPIANPKIARKQAKSMKLLWDVSYSMKDRTIEKEFAFLEAYFAGTEMMDVQVVTFSDAIIRTKNFKVESGDWFRIRQLLEASVYDGATSYKTLFNNNKSHDELLVFTDGMNTLSDFPEAKTQPLFVINSNTKGNHSASRLFGEANGGGYINLADISIEDAISKLRYLPLQFLGVKTKVKGTDFYPKEGATVFNDFSFAAKGLSPGQEVELQFGYEDVVTLKETFVVPVAKGTEQIAKIWAQKKVAELEKFGEDQKTSIIAIAKEFNLVTNFTSLIVLESLADYEQYAITPPQELMDDKKLLEQKKSRLTTSENKSVNDKKNRENSSFVKSVETDDISLDEGAMASVNGQVTDPDGNAMLGVNVVVDGSPNGTQTDFDGYYILEVPVGSNLVFTYVGFDTLETTIRGNGTINIGMRTSANTLDTVLITGYTGNTRDQKVIGYSVTTLEAGDINDKPEADAVRSLTGKIAGAQIVGASGATGSGTNFIIRSKSSINGNNQPLFIVDGIPFNANTNAQGGLGAGSTVTSSRILDMDPNMIQSVQVLKGLSAAVLYGQEGRNGVVIIKTKNDPSSGLGSSNYYINAEAEREEQARKRRELMKEKTIKELGFSTVYLEELQSGIGVEDMYVLYLNQREAYSNHPSYFIDVYEFFRNANAQFADRILSNIIEIDNDNYELLRVYAYKMEEKGDFETAAFIYRQVLKLRSEDAQSYRDLALALAEIGEQDEALSLLTQIVKRDVLGESKFRNYEEIKSIVANEIANLIQTKNLSKTPQDNTLDLSTNVEMDMRVVIDWNHNDTDIDLHIVDPNLEECFYGNNTTKMGGRLSEDMTEGFGPEEFSLANAVSGSYYIKIDYFSDNYQKVENPTFMKVSIYENYGTKEQQRRIKVMRLTKEGDEKLVERIALL